MLLKTYSVFHIHMMYILVLVHTVYQIVCTHGVEERVHSFTSYDVVRCSRKLQALTYVRTYVLKHVMVLQYKRIQCVLYMYTSESCL